jgi:hypothetical protein
VWLIPAAVTVNVRTDVPDAVRRDEESVRLEEHDRARELAHHDALTPDGNSDTANVAGCEEPESRVTFTAITALCLLESVNDPVEVETDKVVGVIVVPPVPPPVPPTDLDSRHEDADETSCRFAPARDSERFEYTAKRFPTTFGPIAACCRNSDYGSGFQKS